MTAGRTAGAVARTGPWKSTASDAKDGGTDAENPLIIDLYDTFVEV